MIFGKKKSLITLLAIISMLMWPLSSNSFEYSKELIALGAASNSSKASTYYDLFSCQLPACVEIKKKLDKVEEELKVYDEKLYQLIVNIEDPQIAELEKSTNNLQLELDDPQNINCKGDIKTRLSRLRVELVESAGSINPEINNIAGKISDILSKRASLEAELIDAALAKSREELYGGMYSDGYDEEVKDSGKLDCDN